MLRSEGMRVMSLLFALLLSVSTFTGCAAAANGELPGKSAPQDTTTEHPLDAPTPADYDHSDGILRVNISIGDAVFEARFLDNESTRALLDQMPLTLEMTDHAGQEKVIALPFELPPASTEKPDAIHAGDLYLWSGNQLVLFYTTFANGYDGYVRLGAIEDVDNLAEALGSGDVTVTIEITHPTEDSILVAYFSCTGNTERIAKLIAEKTGADLYPITPEALYTPEDLDYGNSSSRTSIEQNDPSARPAISGPVKGIEKYDTVFLGYPIWWGQAPKIISTFLESHDFSSKAIVPFCTSGSSGVGSSDTNLHSLCAASTHWLPGERFSASVSRESVGAWIDGLGILTTGGTKNVGVFNFETKTVLLNSGYEMPILGMGTYSLSDDECFNSVTTLLNAGGRLIDTAYMYHNEESLGRAIRESSVPREEIFVITKLYPSQFFNAEDAIDEALQKLDKKTMSSLTFRNWALLCRAGILWVVVGIQPNY